MIAVATVLDRAGDTVGEGLPRVGAALVLLIVGLLVARLVGRGVAKALEAAGVDGFGERTGVHDALERYGGPRSLSRVTGRAIRTALVVIVLLAAVSLLSLGFLQESINAGVLFVPTLLVALVLLLAGVVIGTFAKGRVDRLAYQLDLPGPLGRVAELAIVAIFAVTALAQVGVSIIILTILVAVLLGGMVLAAALAIGLGSRDAIRGASAGRIVRHAFEPGQAIAVAGVRGTILEIEASATVLETPLGARVRIPNHLMVDEIVEIDAPGTPPAPQV
jgi:small-conductance mechanosensitive channel